MGEPYHGGECGGKLPSMAFDLMRALSAQAEGKAIPAHPALQGSDPVSIYSPGANRKQAALSQREAPRHMEAYGGREAIDWLMDCIGLYTDAISVAPWHLERADGTKLVKERTDGTPPDTEIGPKALYDLLDRPNPFMLYDELVDLLIIDLMLVGNAYWFKWRMNSEGKPLALYRLAPSHVRIIPGSFGPERYEYKPPGARDPLKIPANQIVHYKRPNPHSAYYGMGVIQGGGRAFDLEIAITDTMASYYENKADPSLIIQSERRVPRDVFHKLRAQLRARIGGHSNAGELLVLEAGLKASSLSTSASDALFDKLSKMSRDRVFTKFRASPVLFGLLDEAGGSNKVSDARREFDNATLRPFTERLQRRISEAIAAAWGVKFVIDYRYTMPPEEAVKVAGELSRAPGIKLREVRRQYAQFGIEESTGDPELDEMVLNLPGEELDENGQPVQGDAAFADQPVGSEPGRPPKPGNTRAFPRGSKVRAPAGKAITVEEIERRLKLAEDKALTQHRTTVGNRLPGEQRPQDPFESARDRAVDDTADFIRAGLDDAVHNLERALLDHVEGKAFTPSNLLSRMRGSAAWNTFRDAIMRVIEEGVQRAISQAVIHNAESGLTPGEELDYDEIAGRVIDRADGPHTIIRTLKNSLAKKVKEALGSKANQQAVNQIVRESLDEWRTGKAEVVGMTEAVHAYNEATLTVAEASGVTEVFVTDGNDHDEPCREADGSVWSIPEARERRLEHPNCRRAFLPLVT